MDKIEILILKNLIYNDEYVRKILPYIKSEYFQDHTQRIIFEEIYSFICSYNKLPSKEAIEIEVQKRTDLNEKSYSETIRLLSEFEYEPVEFQWLNNVTEKWCKDRAMYLALMESIQIADGSEEKKNVEAIPDILQEALSVSFDTNIGHDYVDDAELRFEKYHKKEEKIEFDLDYFNKITNNGVSKKTLNVVMAAPGVGKSLFLCHITSAFLSQGRNVLYVTLEMSEEKIAERIDANLFDVDIQNLYRLSKQQFISKTNQLKQKTQGKLIIKEYAPGIANSTHFKNLLKELELKKNFIPEVIVIDYLNLCSSSRYKAGSTNSYTYVKAIAEELRAIAVENDLPIFSATQVNRSGASTTEMEMTDTSECIYINEKIETISGEIKTINELKVGDQIKSQDNYKTVITVHHKKNKDCIKIKLESGKSIIVSKDHVFPTNNGRKSINTGLKIGDLLNSMTNEKI